MQSGDIEGRACSGVAAGCSKQAYMANLPPFLPPQYYDCIEVTPMDLVTSYFSGYTNASAAELAYNDKYFVFKKLHLKDWMITDLSQGYIWAGSGIKCELVNVDDMKDFEIDDQIDVVGYNAGVTSYEIPGLLFKDCYVLPTGAVKLPAVGGGGFNPAY